MLAVGGLEWIRTIPAPIVYGYVLLLMVPPLVIAALPFASIFLAAACVATGRAAALLQAPVVSYGLIGSALMASEFHRKDIMHLIYGCPVLLIAFWVLWDVVDGRPARRRLSFGVLGSALLVVMGSQGLRAASADQVITTRRGTIVVPQDDEALRFLLSDRVTPGEYVFVYPYYPTYYFLANVRNPTRYGELIYGPGSRPYFEDAIAAIEARQVRYVLWDTLVDADTMTEWFPANQPPSASERLMEKYFEEHYQQIDVLNGFRILRRK
jgi:hypothetical protein